ncbi:MAG: hypothetical protein ACPG80_04720, partial [Rickettsiales bacterium]
MCGMELEAWLADGGYSPKACNKPFLEQLNHRLVGPELSQFNFELNSTPIALNSAGDALSQMHNELESTWQACTACAGEMGLNALAIGVLPTLKDKMLSPETMSTYKRYEALNKQLFAMQGDEEIAFHIEEGEGLHLEQADIMLEAAATSLQVHFQIPQRRAVRAYNASQIASAPLVSASCNAPYLYGKALWEETRIAIFERAVPGGHLRDEEGRLITRVGFGSGYAKESLMEPFSENMTGYPPLLPTDLGGTPEMLNHLRLHNGTVWRWNRPLIGVDENTGEASLRIEHRAMSAGPTISDIMANIAFYLGLTTALMMEETAPETQLPFAKARDNFYAAAQNGLNAELAWLDGKNHKAQDLCMALTQAARKGLEQLGILEDDIARYVDGILVPRIASGQTGSAWQKAYIAKHGPEFAK